MLYFCFQLKLIAQNANILTAIVDESLIYYSLDNNALKIVPLSNTDITYQIPRSLEYNTDLCEFYVITAFRSVPKLHKIAIDGKVTFIGNLTMSNGKSIYSCEAIAYNAADKTLYGSISYPNLDYYTETLVSINSSNAKCTEVSTIITNEPISDMDFLACVDGDLLIGDGDNAPFYKIYSQTLAGIGATCTPIEIYSDNLTTSKNQQELAVIGNYLYVENNKNLYRADLTDNTLNFELDRTFNIPYSGPLLAMAAFPYNSIFNFNNQLSSDTLICEGDTITLNKSNFDSFTWNDGSTETERNITQAGIYFGEGKIGSCLVYSDTFELKTKPCNKCEDYYEEIQYYLMLGRDIEMCYGEFYSIVLPRIIDSVFWSDGTKGRAKHITETNTLSATIKIDSCIYYTDTIQFDFVNCDDCKVHFPNAFTPNEDAINNTFRPKFNDACNYRFQRFEVYNRWGEKLYEDTKGEWDGYYLNAKVPQGLYFYIAKVKEYNANTTKTYSGSILVIY